MLGRHEALAHVALIEPEIPWNSGNAGRSCLAFGARLHLVGPLGFSLDERAVRRAGLDYWAHVNPGVFDSWERFEAELLGPGGRPWLISPDGDRAPWEVALGPSPVLVFGKESTGLPESLRARYAGRRLRIPMGDGPVRSLNVSTAIGILLYEVLRQESPR